MALVVLASAKGSPGTTTAALAVAALWPRNVLLADCDPIGGDVAVRMPGIAGSPLDADRGLVSLAAAGRNGLDPALLAEHAQPVAGGLEVIAGLRGPEQATGLEPFWPALARVAAAVPGADVIADVGRFQAGSPVLPLVQAAHLVVLVCRPTLSSLVHLRERLGALVPSLAGAGGWRPTVGVVVVGDAGGERDAASVVEVLGRTATPPDRIWRLALDPRGAAVFDGGHVRRPERTDLARSAATLAGEMAALVDAWSRPAEPAEAGHPARRATA